MLLTSIEFTIPNTNELIMKNVEALAANEGPTVYCKLVDATVEEKEISRIVGTNIETTIIRVQTTKACKGKGNIRCNAGEKIETVWDVIIEPIAPLIPVNL